MSMRCSGCGAAMAAFLTAPDFNRAASRETFRYERCPACGLVSLANVPADLSAYYEAGYHALPASAADLEAGAAHDRYKIELVMQFVRGGRLVEVGPSWGAFCLLAKRNGFTVDAIEMDPRCCEFLRAQLGVNAVQAADAAAALAKVPPPDVIALWHVFEHLRDPWALLEAAARALRPGGALVIATPNPAAFQFARFGRRWTHLDAPRHVHLIPASLLAERAGKCGLQLLLATTRDEGSLGWNDFGWRFSLATFAEAPLAKRALRFAGRLAAPLFAPIEAREGRGSAYTAVFGKPR